MKAKLSQRDRRIIKRLLEIGYMDSASSEWKQDEWDLVNEWDSLTCRATLTPLIYKLNKIAS